MYLHWLQAKTSLFWCAVHFFSCNSYVQCQVQWFSNFCLDKAGGIPWRISMGISWHDRTRTRINVSHWIIGCQHHPFIYCAWYSWTTGSDFARKENIGSKESVSCLATFDFETSKNLCLEWTLKKQNPRTQT